MYFVVHILGIIHINESIIIILRPGTLPEASHSSMSNCNRRLHVSYILIHKQENGMLTCHYGICATAW